MAKSADEKPITGKAMLAKVIEASAACVDNVECPVAAKFLAAIAAK